MHYYIHIPFCRQKCPYCKFALTPVFDEFKKKRYIEHLKKEIREYFDSVIAKNETTQKGNGKESLISTGLLRASQWPKPDTIKTIYFGWGTPSVLSLDEVQDILECFPFYNKEKQGKISRCPQIQGSALMTENWESSIEITFECNPEDITTEYVSWLLDIGINRISLWVQSLNDTTLAAIHRSNESTIFSALDWINTTLEPHKYSDISVNIDFILWLPHVQIWQTLEDIKTLHRKYPFITHTSVYILEKWLYPKSWKSHTLDDSVIQEEYMNILEYFESIWWNHYELSNWARPGYESIHNQSYWDHSDTRGFGLSAASYIAQRRFSNSDSFSGYYKWRLLEDEILTPEQIALEDIMFWLRTSLWYNTDNPELTLNEWKLQEFISSGYVIREWEKIKLTKTWIFLIDYIMSELIS